MSGDQKASARRTSTSWIGLHGKPGAQGGVGYGRGSGLAGWVLRLWAVWAHGFGALGWVAQELGVGLDLSG